MLKFKKYIVYILSLPKTIYFNLKTLPLKQAFKLPIFISHDTKIKNAHKGIIDFKKGCKIQPFIVSFGFAGTSEIVPNKSILDLRGGKLLLNNNVHISKGFVIAVNGELEFGENFSANRNLFIFCNKKISFGDNVLIGWNVTLLDGDGHKIFHRNTLKDGCVPIQICNKVWLCAEVHIMKGSLISDSSVVAYRSTVSGKFIDSSTLIGGSPAKKIQTDISWEK